MRIALDVTVTKKDLIFLGLLVTTTVRLVQKKPIVSIKATTGSPCEISSSDEIKQWTWE